MGVPTPPFEPAVEAVRATLALRKRRVEAFLEQFFAAKLAEAAIAPDSHELVNALRQFVLAGGKRIRAALVGAGYLCYAEEPADDRLVIAGAALEVIHAFFLAHDDVFDQDVTRHGLPTLHQRFTESLRPRAAPAEVAHYGSAMAILAGDVAAVLAFDLLATAPAEPERLLAATRTLARIAMETGFGEALDVLAELQPHLEEERVLLIHRYKTAKYTIEGPLHIGAILAGAGERQLARLSAVAVPLGIAYQLQDDMLGVFGSESVTGKPVGADLRQGKHTLLSVHGLHGPYAAQLASLIGNPAIDAEGVRLAQDYLREGGSVAYSEARATALVREAREALGRLEVRPEAHAFLSGLITLLAGRAA